MSLDVKSLKKLAAVCRKAGIKHYKSADFEFTLTDDAPVAKQPRSAKIPAVSDTSKFESDTLSQEELLFWSSGVTSEDTPGEV